MFEWKDEKLPNRHPASSRTNNDRCAQLCPRALGEAVAEIALREMSGREIEIPLIIDGEKSARDTTFEVSALTHHGRVLGVCHQAGPKRVEMRGGRRRAWQNLVGMP